MKFIVPFLEQASLEEPSSTLVDLWANLLASAAEEFDPHHIYFVSMISRMSPSQGKVLKEIIGTEHLSELASAITFLDPTYGLDREERFKAHMMADGRAMLELDALGNFIRGFFNLTGKCKL
jgi:hypothetical protein